MSKLIILHLYDYQKPEGSSCPVTQFKKTVNPLALSTCMRHIYVFSTKQLPNEALIPSLMAQLKTSHPHQKLPQVDVCYGKEAYAKLLLWSIGGLNNKKPFNDPRILGDLRQFCFSYSKAPANSQKNQAWNFNKKIMDALLTDSKRLLELANSLQEPLEIKRRLLQTACERCAWARDENYLAIINSFEYGNFLTQEKMLVHLKVKLDYLQSTTERQLNSLSKSRASFFGKAVNINERLTVIRELQQRLELPEYQESQSMTANEACTGSVNLNL
ncbi:MULTISPECIES: hypothetical protein [unclassified Legionella]|uniref:hypothetical protein n=1 Tax=unclassified Legionella TaxID=2622702 RepID=UPI0010549D4C|nr:MULTISPECIES: hypothetical protein [unclassified Legionella]MDI9817846.1 hypothetical protein [Legionella sp. PL877]